MSCRLFSSSLGGENAEDAEPRKKAPPAEPPWATAISLQMTAHGGYFFLMYIMSTGMLTFYPLLLSVVCVSKLFSLPLATMGLAMVTSKVINRFTRIPISIALLPVFKATFPNFARIDPRCEV